MHHVPVERCADILASMSGTRPSDGWVHGLLERAARAVAAANKAIRALIILARVLCGDETPLRAGPGPKTRKKYLQVACTSLLTYYFLGDRYLRSFKGFVYSDLHGTVVVHDRYVNYDALRRHQPPAVHPAHCSETWKTPPRPTRTPIWPGQIAGALRGLIHAANLARGQGLAAVPGEMTAEHLTCSATASPSGCPRSAASPAPKRKQPPARTCWNACGTAKPTCCGSSPTPPSRRPPTRPIMPSSGLCGHGAGCPGTRARPAWRGQHKYSGYRQGALSGARDGDVVK